MVAHTRAAHVRRATPSSSYQPPIYRPLAGLTETESREFAELDASDPCDGHGYITWSFEGTPLNSREARWLALYRKHRSALGGAPCRLPIPARTDPSFRQS
jgi:hypothetical protein